ncbi:MAG TPA: hypothetical protein VF163_16375 [Micromonosporaceae bacterium]
MVFDISELSFVDSHVRWYDSEVPWRPEDGRRYVDGGFNGLELRAKRRKSSDIRFLRDLPGLRGVRLIGPGLANDADVFELEDLECLFLLNKATQPLRAERLGRLSVLGLDDRPGLAAVRSLERLRKVVVWRWRGTDLSFLGSHPSLQFLRLEGMRQSFDLVGIEGNPWLQVLWVDEAQVESLAPLSGLSGLKFLTINGSRHGGSPARLDLDALRNLASVEWLTLSFCGAVTSLAPLRDLANLRGLTLTGTEVTDGDLTPLLDLPPTVESISLFDRPHHSHRLDEILRLRSAR